MDVIMETYIQIGEIAPRAPNGDFLPATPIYKAVPIEEAPKAENALSDNAAMLFYEKMKTAAAACKAAGIKTRRL